MSAEAAVAKLGAAGIAAFTDRRTGARVGTVGELRRR
jgi:hypothetical protein